MRESFQNNKSPELSSESKASPEKFIYSVEKEWIGLEEKFKEIEDQVIEGEGSEEKISKAKIILKNTANSVFYFMKKTTINLGITATLLTAYTGIDINKQAIFKDKEKAKKEIEFNGITNDQKVSAYKPGLSELIYRSVTPLGYQENVDDYGFNPNLFKKLDSLGVSNINMIQSIIPNLLIGRKDRAKMSDSIKNAFDKEYLEKTELFLRAHNIDDKDSFFTNGSKELIDQYSNIETELAEKWNKISQKEAFTNFNYLNNKDYPNREDAWRIYLGLSQENNTFLISDFKPAKSKDDKYYYKINNFWKDFSEQQIKETEVFSDVVTGDKSSLEVYSKIVNEMLGENNLKGKIDFVKKFGGEKRRVHFWSTSSGKNEEDHIMGNYTFGIGEDEKGSYVYYYDKWDLASAFASNPILKGVGNPYEIYDRLYYNPETFELINISN